MYCIETTRGIERNIFKQVLTFDTKQEANNFVKIFNESWKAKIIEYNPFVHGDIKLR